MQTDLHHFQINVRSANLPFYKDLFHFLGWNEIYGDSNMLGVVGTGGVSLWFAGNAKEVANDYDGPGMNHISIGTKTQGQVDEASAYLKEHGVEWLFETPRHRPDFVSNDGNTYYQVMFESPDRILFEVVYTGLKSA